MEVSVLKPTTLYLDRSPTRILSRSTLEYLVIHRISLANHDPIANPFPIADEDLTGSGVVKAFRNRALGTGATTPYHVLIRYNGIVDQLLPLSNRGAHARGYNKKSIGIAVAGRSDKNPVPITQSQALIHVLEQLWPYQPGMKISGHTALPGDWKGKDCPGKFLPTDTIEKLAEFRLNQLGWKIWGDQACLDWVTTKGWVI